MWLQGNTEEFKTKFFGTATGKVNCKKNPCMNILSTFTYKKHISGLGKKCVEVFVL